MYISQRLSTEYKELVQNNRHYVATVALVCAQQGIALRGHGDDMHDPSVNPGNFKVIVNLLSHYDEIVKEHVVEGPRNATYLGHVIQNELLEVMASEVKKKIETELHEATYYTLIVDYTKDVSKKEQLAVILRYVYQGVIHERLIEYVHATQFDAASLTKYILCVLSELQLHIEHCVSQCYDGASVMRGSISGVSARIKELNNKAVYIHCCAHRLNLVLVDSVKANPITEDFLCIFKSFMFSCLLLQHMSYFLSNKENLA